MTAIRLTSSLVPAVRTGKKQTTIRLGHRPYIPGPGLLVTCEHEIRIEILDVIHTQVDRLTPDDAIADGYRDLSDLRTALDGFYPGMDEAAAVTVVRFRLA